MFMSTFKWGLTTKRIASTMLIACLSTLAISLHAQTADSSRVIDNAPAKTVDIEPATTDQVEAISEEIPAASYIALEGYFDTDKVLEGGQTYLVQHNVKVNKNATLTIPANTTLLFEPNTSLVIEGGLNVSGKPNAFVNFKSVNDDRQGTGLLISGAEGGDINIQYAKFHKLQTPLNFDMDWYRANVSVKDCEFKDMNTGESNIMIVSPLSSLYTQADKKTMFIFSNNNFVNNWGSIYIENLQDDVLDLQFENNLITNNVVYGIDQGIPSNTPLFGYYDNGDKRFAAQLKGNSIFGNYQINAATDTIIREISVGIQGEGETFDIPGNYFRSTDPNVISAGFDHFYQNNTLPLLRPEPSLTTPPAAVHGHIYKVFLGDKEVKNYSEIPKDVASSNVTFKVYFNRPVTEFGETQMESVFYDTINNGIRVNNVELGGPEWSNDGMVYTFTVGDAAFLKNELGYVVIKNFKDPDGFIVPDFTIGQRKAINNYSKLYNAGVASTYFPPAEVINNPGGFVPDAQDLEILEELSELGDLSYLGAYTSLAKTWELGIQAGSMGYLGDLASNFMDKDDFRWGFGIYGQYNISKWFSTRAQFLYGRISGSDFDESDPNRQLRANNFRSEIYEGSLTVHFHLLQYGISKGEKFSPSIYAGIAVFGYSPESRIFTGKNELGENTYLAFHDGIFEASSEKDATRNEFVWVPTNAIGTEGQTTNITDVGTTGNTVLYSRTPPKKEKKWNIAIPFGVNLDFIINKSWVIGVEGGFRFTFTDYLDDVSGYYWDRGFPNGARNSNFDPNNPADWPHQSIIEANTTIKGRVGNTITGDKITVPNTVTIITPSSELIEVPTAMLLANPSLAGALTSTGGEVSYGGGSDNANTFPSARKGDTNRDWYAYFGLKVSKVFGYNKQNRKLVNSTLTDY